MFYCSIAQNPINTMVSSRTESCSIPLSAVFYVFYSTPYYMSSPFCPFTHTYGHIHIVWVTSLIQIAHTIWAVAYSYSMGCPYYMGDEFR